MKMSQIKQLRKTCIELDFAGVKILEKYSNRELTFICNGIGPEWFSPKVRNLVSWVYDYLSATAFMHDIEFTEQVGFDIANAHFLINGRKEIKAKNKWYDPRRYYRLHKATQFYILLDNFGKEAYKQAGIEHKKYKKHKNKKRRDYES